jgi:hypothetical protein
MKMKIEFSMDSSAFSGYGMVNMEVMDILKTISNKLSWDENCGVIMDSNGNRIGQWIVED